MSDAIAILVLGIVGSDLLLVHLIGACPALAVSRKFETAAGLAAAIVIVSPFAFLLSALALVLLPESITPLSGALPFVVLANLLAIYAGAYLVLAVTPRLYSEIEPFIPLLAVNCVVLGVVLLGLGYEGSLFAQFLFALGLSIGYALFLIIFSEIRERLAFADVPEPLRDAPIAILTMAILSLALFGLGV